MLATMNIWRATIKSFISPPFGVAIFLIQNSKLGFTTLFMMRLREKKLGNIGKIRKTLSAGERKCVLR